MKIKMTKHVEVTYVHDITLKYFCFSFTSDKPEEYNKLYIRDKLLNHISSIKDFDGEVDLYFRDGYYNKRWKTITNCDDISSIVKEYKGDDENREMIIKVVDMLLED